MKRETAIKVFKTIEWLVLIMACLITLHGILVLPLTDTFYGKTNEELYKTIYFARAGVMPFWINRLDDNTIKQLSLYVHSLGGGVK